MKQLFLSVSFTVCIFHFAQAQTQDKQLPKKVAAKHKNIVKLNLSTLLYTNFQMQYERLLGRKTSVALGLSYLPSLLDKSITSNRNFQDKVDNDIDYSNIKFSSAQIIPEFRFYTKQAGKGFYIAPYAKYRNIQLKVPVQYVGDSNQTHSVSMDGKINSGMLGIMIGTQFKLYKKITMDIFLIGGNITFSKLNMNYKNSQSLNQDDLDKLRTTLSDIKNSNSILKNINYNVNPNEGNANGNILLGSLRGAGINIGYRF